MFSKLYLNQLNKIEQNQRLRRLPKSFDAKLPYINFTSNDYLNLSKDNRLLNSGYQAASKYGSGATGSRMLSGNLELFEEFEAKIAKDKKTESALIFNSGFQTNFSVLSSLISSVALQNTPIVFFDRLNHSSLYQAIFNKKVELKRYKHNDIAHLEDLLIECQHDTRPKFIVTETLFGMDGDFAQIDDLIVLARKHNAFLYLDEAHATGVFGKNGYGIAEDHNFEGVEYLLMGTFSKALGSSGGYIACSRILKDYIINCCTGFIYSTANSPFVIGAASAAWDILPSMHNERLELLERAKALRNELKRLGFDIGNTESHIIPIILGDESEALSYSAKLRDKGLVLMCVRPPTVPPNSSRLRLALCSTHNQQDINQLIDGLKNL